MTLSITLDTHLVPETTLSTTLGTRFFVLGPHLVPHNARFFSLEPHLVPHSYFLHHVVSLLLLIPLVVVQILSLKLILCSK